MRRDFAITVMKNSNLDTIVRPPHKSSYLILSMKQKCMDEKHYSLTRILRTRFAFKGKGMLWFRQHQKEIALHVDNNIRR